MPTGTDVERFETAFELAASRWKSVITGYQPGITLNGVNIDFLLTELIGKGTSHVRATNDLEQSLGLPPNVATLTFGNPNTGGAFFFRGNPDQMVSKGEIAVDPRFFVDLPDSAIRNTLIHELGHVLALNPSLVEGNEVFSNGDMGDYSGIAGLAAYQEEFMQPSASFIPVIGGSFHWNIEDASNPPTDMFGRSFSNEIMRPTNKQTFFSRTAAELLRDFGYTVTPPVQGDFNYDRKVDVADIDFYSGKIGESSDYQAELDLDNDGQITLLDHALHVTTLVETTAGTGTLLGDLNLDGTVNILDDAAILNANLGKTNTSYADGDLNADGVVNTLGDAAILVGNLGN